jgi:15-cis-phytoene synthase
MIALYNDFSSRSSKTITHMYSTSFTLGIKMLDKKLHNPIYSIYGLVRLADEIVDTFHEFDKKILLDRFRKETFQAIEEGISTNPIIHSYQQVVREYKIDNHLTEAFFDSMEMDLHKIDYNENNYNEYIYGSAEVVGLMCLKIFVNGDENLYNNLKPGAKALGAAFQKVNFLRDMQSDFEERGRTYFPGVDFIQFSEHDKKQIEKDIDNDFAVALSYIKMLPQSSKIGVYLAYRYYVSLFAKIKAAKASDILKKRFRVPDYNKLALLAKVYLRGMTGAV